MRGRSAKRRLSGCVTRLKLRDDVLELHASALQQHEQEKQQVGRLGNDFVVAFRDRGQRHLQAFFTDFLREALRALRK